MWNRRSSLGIVIHSITSFLILIILLIIANLLVPSINNDVYLRIVQFFDSLLGLFIILFVIGMINSLFWNFEFPLNILAPISGAFLGAFIVSLVSKILGFTQTFYYFDIFDKIFAYPISTIVFVAVLIIGYLMIIIEASKREERYPREERKEEEKKKDVKEKKKHAESSLDDSLKEVGDELRKVPGNIRKALNKSTGKKNKKKK
jgi:hypothetical protein